MKQSSLNASKPDCGIVVLHMKICHVDESRHDRRPQGIRPDTLGKSAQRIVQTDKEAAADLP
jgi:hypothetical protein